MPVNTFDNPQAALSFLFSELTFVEQEVLRQPYPEIKYPSILPVSTEASDWAESIAFKTIDFAGEPELLADRAQDVPLLDVASSKGSVSVHDYALGYSYTLAELGKAQELAQNSRSAAINYLAEKPNGVRQSVEQFLDKAFIQGDGRTLDVGTGLINDAGVPTASTGQFLPSGSDKTIDTILSGSDPNVVAQELLALFNGAVEEVRVSQVNTIFRPTHILLPPKQFGKMRTFRIPNTAETLISYLERVINITFDELIHLRGAGAGGNDRMMVYTRDDKYVKAHMPLPFTLQPPETQNNLKFISGGMVRIAGTEIRIPQQHLYVDDV